MKTFTTSKNFKFTRTKTGWLDETSGLEWEVEFKTNINQYDAEAWAKEKGKSLPTQEQFIKAEYHGIRELPEMEWKDHWFWSSSTVYPVYSDVAYAFYGDNGSASSYGYRTGSVYVIAARCVSPASGQSGVKVDSEFKIDRTSSEVERLKKAKALITEAMELMEGIWE